MEDLNLTANQQRAYDAVSRVLSSAGDFLETSPIPSLVRLDWTTGGGGVVAPGASTSSAPAGAAATTTTPGVRGIDHEEAEEEVVTIITPSRGHHELYRRLEELEGLEKEESTLLERAEATVTLTGIVTGMDWHYYGDGNPQLAVRHLFQLGQAVPRRVCQHPFRRNDIVWVCKTCQADETCVLCHSCFSQSNHEGHDVAFYHAQAGGCCDCGDPDGAFRFNFRFVCACPAGEKP
jgi:hypothetical protein